MEERGRSRIKYTKEAGDDSEVKQLRGNLEKFRSVHTREAKDNSIVEQERGNLEEFESWWPRRPVRYCSFGE